MSTLVNREAAPRARRKRRLWRVWRRARWPFVVGLLVASWVLGYIGYHRAGNVDSPAYAAFQLFAFEGQPEDAPLTLTIARFLAPIAAAWVIVLTVLSVLGERMELLLLRLIARNHVVVLGLGELGERLAQRFAETGQRVVAVESDPANVAIDRCRDCGVAVVKGDADSPTSLRRANLRHARLLFVTCGDDQVNLDVAVHAVKAVGASRGQAVTAYVHLDDVALWRLLKAEALATPETFPIAVEFFNVLDESARRLLRTHPPFEKFAGAEPRQPHVVVVGGEGLGERVVGHVGRLWQTSAPLPGEALRLTIVAPDASERVASLLYRYPGLGDVCELDAYPVDLAGSEIADAPGVEPLVGVTAAYVCLARDTHALATALALRARIRRPGVPIVIAVRDEDSAVAELVAGGADDVTAFGTLTHALAPEAVLRGTIETIALTMHENYLRTQLAKGEQPGSRPALVPWSELPERYKQSNRRFAEGVGEKLDAVGCALVPAPLAGPVAPFAFSDDEVERLARLEHERWARDLRRDQWRDATAQGDADKLHPLLSVSWDELSEDNRDKDRTAVRKLPAMLAAAGFAIYRLHGGEPEPAETPGVPVAATNPS